VRSLVDFRYRKYELIIKDKHAYYVITKSFLLLRNKKMYSVIKRKTFKISNHEMRNIIEKYAKILDKETK